MRRLIALAFVLVALAGARKSYFHPALNVEVRLQPNGDVRVVQERVYSFSGSFSLAYVSLDKLGCDGIVLNGLYEKQGGMLVPVQPSDLRDSSQSLYVRWEYRARNEVRTFVLDYTVYGALRRYEDCAEFHWRVIESEHARVASSRVELVLPGPAPELFKVWVHVNAPPGRLDIRPEQGRATVETRMVPGNTFLEVRTVFDPGLFPGAPLVAGKRHERVLLEEKRNFLGRNVRLVLVPLGLVLILVVPLAMLLLFYRRYGREPSMQYDVVYEHEPPRPAPPVVVGTMLHQKPDRSTVWSFTFRGVFASLLELCRQRVVSVQELKEGDRRRYQFTLERPDLVEKLEPFSRSAAVFLFHRVAGPGNVLTDRMLRDYARNNQAAFRCLLNELDARATGWWRRELGVDIIGPDSEQAYRRYMLITVLLLTAGAAGIGAGTAVVVPTGAGGSWVLGALAALAAGFGFAAGGRSILRWSEPAYLEHRRWKAFRRFLVEFSAIEQAPVSLLPIWEQYYVFAVALGVAKQFLANVTRLAAERGAAMVVPAWYAAAGSGQAGMAALSDSMAGFASFAGNFSGMVSSFSSSTTSGGGFSGGGGGGGGGGSSGAG